MNAQADKVYKITTVTEFQTLLNPTEDQEICPILTI